MDRLLVISADSHAGLPSQDYRSYLAPGVRDDFATWLATAEQRLRASEDASLDPAFVARFQAHPAVQAGGLRGLFDHARRVQEMDTEGVAADVIFPAAQHQVQPPFDPLASPNRWTPEQQVAGAQAYNRWLAEFCAVAPARHAGLALIVPDDIPSAVAEIAGARRAGLRGILLPSIADADRRPFPIYSDKRYDPLWAACQELDLPIHTHPWRHPRIHGREQGADFVDLLEQQHTDRRLLSFLIHQAVFERFPRLRFVMADQGARWVAATLQDLDTRATAIQQRGVFEKLSLKPSEYFTRNCWVTAPAMSRADCDARSALGVHKLMWGSGYPEPNGTWPTTRVRLQEAFAGLPPRETSALLGETAARLYGFDLAQLRPVAARIGPARADLAATAAAR